MTCIFTATKIEISQENVKQRRQFSVRGTIIDRKNVPPPCNHLDIGALRLPTLARNRGGDWLMPSQDRQPQRTGVQVVAGGGRFFCLWSTKLSLYLVLPNVVRLMWKVAFAAKLLAASTSWPCISTVGRARNHHSCRQCLYLAIYDEDGIARRSFVVCMTSAVDRVVHNCLASSIPVSFIPHVSCKLQRFVLRLNKLCKTRAWVVLSQRRRNTLLNQHKSVFHVDLT